MKSGDDKDHKNPSKLKNRSGTALERPSSDSRRPWRSALRAPPIRRFQNGYPAVLWQSRFKKLTKFAHLLFVNSAILLIF